MNAFLTPTGASIQLIYAALTLILFFGVGLSFGFLHSPRPSRNITIIASFGAAALAAADGFGKAFGLERPERGLITLLPVFVLMTIYVINPPLVARLGPRKVRSTRRENGTLGVIPGCFATASIVTFLFLIGISKFGSGYYSRLANDWPNYIFSVYARTSPELFSDNFSTNLANYQLYRASGEKPGATTLLFFASDFWGRNVEISLGVITIVSVFLTAGNLYVFVGHFSKSKTNQFFAVIIGVFNPIVISRVLDAQVGHLLTYVFFSAVCAVLPSIKEHWSLVNAAVLGVLGAGLVLVGPTLALASLPLLFSLGLLVGPKNLRPTFVSATTMITVVLAVPEGRGLLRSLSAQTTNSDGFPVAFPTPTEVIGLSIWRNVPTPGWWLLVSWSVALAIVVLLIGGSVAYRSVGTATNRWIFPLSVGATLVALSFFSLRRGIDSYQAHKFATLAFLMWLPLVSALLLNRINYQRLKVRHFPLLLAIPPVCLMINASTSTTLRVGDPFLSEQTVIEATSLQENLPINIDSEDTYLDSYLPIVLREFVTQSVSKTYASGTFPISGYAISRTRNSSNSYLNFGHRIADVDKEVRLSKVDLLWRLGSGPEALGRYLTGRWSLHNNHLSTAEREFFLSIEIPEKSKMLVSLEYGLFLPPKATRTIQAFDCSGTLLMEKSFANHKDIVVQILETLHVPSSFEQRDECHGHFVIRMKVPPPVDSIDIDGWKNQTVSFFLTGADVTPSVDG